MSRTTELPDEGLKTITGLGSRIRGRAIGPGSVVVPLLAIGALMAYFSLRSDAFLTASNLVNISQQSAVLLLISLAGTIVILIGSIDLSVAANMTLASLLTARLIDDAGVLATLVAVLATGAAVGAANGILVTAFKLPSFLVTLGTMSILIGVSGWISGGSPIIFSDTRLPAFAASRFLGVPSIVWVALLTAIALTAIAFRSTFGRYLYAIGGGEQVAALSGVPLRRYKTAAFMLSGALCALGGLIITGQVGAGTSQVGDPYLLDSIAAVVMGGTALSGGVGGPHRTLLGVAVIALLSNGMDVTGVDEFTQNVVKGVVVILAVAVTIDRRKYATIK